MVLWLAFILRKQIIIVRPHFIQRSLAGSDASFPIGRPLQLRLLTNKLRLRATGRRVLSSVGVVTLYLVLGESRV